MKFSRIFRGSGQREWKIRGCIGEGVGDFLGNEERSVDDLGSSGNIVSNFFFNGDSQEFQLHRCTLEKWLLKVRAFNRVTFGKL